MQVELKGKSKKGKERIKQHGPTWTVMWEDAQQFMLQSLNPTFSGGTHDIRKVLKQDDQDFIIERVVNAANKHQD